MASPAQIAANRRNALRSTGPRTREGKARVGQNACPYGAGARMTPAPPESIAEFAAYHHALVLDQQPRDVAEALAIREFAGFAWKMERLGIWEELLCRDNPDEFQQIRVLSTLHPLLIHSYAGLLRTARLLVRLKRRKILKSKL